VFSLFIIIIFFSPQRSRIVYLSRTGPVGKTVLILSVFCLLLLGIHLLLHFFFYYFIFCLSTSPPPLLLVKLFIWIT
jgi:hypothetical protein